MNSNAHAPEPGVHGVRLKRLRSGTGVEISPSFGTLPTILSTGFLIGPNLDSHRLAVPKVMEIAGVSRVLGHRAGRMHSRELEQRKSIWLQPVQDGHASHEQH